jgi:hypothetical protein
MPDEKAVLAALRKFADSVTAKMTTLTAGEPEDRLRGPFEILMQEVGRALCLEVICTGETRLPGRMGKPDYAVHAAKLLAGYIELKAPGIGANPNRFVGHNRDQWKRFQAVPNLIYCDGNEWGLYRNAEPIRPVVRLSGDVASDGLSAVAEKDGQAILGLLTDFLSWQPIIPTMADGKIDLRRFATLLAPLCRMLREDVSEAVTSTDSPMRTVAEDWRQSLFADASDEQFADAYAQTVTFALLLARSEGADPLSPQSASSALNSGHALLSLALAVLTDSQVHGEMSASLSLLLRVLSAIPPASLASPEDPWLYFYEDFLAAYDPKLRKDAGAYYTPVEVVHAQVRLIDDLLTNRLGKTLGFADRDVVTLDPAVGTGTYLLGVIDYALSKVQAQQGEGAAPGQASALAGNVYGFEIMVGPFAVTELRVSRAFQSRSASLPPHGTQIYLTDTLESPHAQPPQYIMGWAQKEFAEQHHRATQVKADVPVIVCLGNPPYDRTEAVDETNKARTGGWVRWGDDGDGTAAIFKDFLDPAIVSGHGVRVHNLYNLYVYFWRWALWKVFEHKTSAGPGVVSFISASSYLDGDAFCGMREHMRRLCDEIWILDLGGEGRGTRKSENVFAIQTPVAIAVAARYRTGTKKGPARVHFARIEGTRQQTLNQLDVIGGFKDIQWETCPSAWQAPFRPAGNGKYFDWPLLTDLFPWQQGGVKAGRTWVIAPDTNTLERRWRLLCNAVQDERVPLFKDSPTGRKVADSPNQLPPSGVKLKAISQLPKSAPAPDIMRYAYRSFDRQYLFADARLLDRPGPALWAAHGDRQVYLTSLFSQPLGQGPTLMACASILDLDHFRGSYGARAVMPLYRDAVGKEANVLAELLDMLAKAYGRKVAPEDFFAYVYGMLAQPSFTDRFADELGTRELRVPLTKDAHLFIKVRDVGAKLLWLHTYGQRYVPKGQHHGQVPKGRARCTKPMPGDASNYPKSCEYNETTRTLRVGDGQFAPIAPEVYEFEISGLKVVQSWLKYRVGNGGGRKSSPLDDIRPEKWTGDFTTELLELLWVLEATIAQYPAQAKLLSAVVKGPCLLANELPPVPDSMRKPPSRHPGKGLFDEAEDEDA